MTAPAGSTDDSAGKDTTTATDETERASSGQTAVQQAASEIARSLPPLSAEQVALVRRTLRDRRR